MNNLRSAFFDPANVQYLSDSIVSAVLNRTGVTIPPQSSNDLFILMNNVIRDLEVNPTNDISSQISLMNNDVINRAYNIIAPKIEMNIYYQQNLGKLPVPLPLPVNLRTTGGKMYENKIGFN